MFAGHTHMLPYIRDYAEALKHWRKTAKPRSKYWQVHQRPLKDTRSPHYRVEVSTDAVGHADSNYEPEYFDVCLYRTALGRFYKPDADGMQRRLYNYYNSQTTHKFMWDVLHTGPSQVVWTTDNRRVHQIVVNSRLPDLGFSTEVWYTKEGKLDVSRSRHYPIYRRVSNTDDKARRKNLRALLDSLLTLAVMRVPEYTQGEMLIHRNYFGGAFNGVDRDFMLYAIRNLCVQLEKGETPDPDHVEGFFKLAKEVFLRLCAARFDQNDTMRSRTRNYRGLATIHYNEIAPIDDKTYADALWRAVQERGPARSVSGKVAYPQFPEEGTLVRSNWYAGKVD